MFVLTLSLISFCIFSLPTRPSFRTENRRRRYLLTGVRGGQKKKITVFAFLLGRNVRVFWALIRHDTKRAAVEITLAGKISSDE